jgi:hypothetical protein
MEAADPAFRATEHEVPPGACCAAGLATFGGIKLGASGSEQGVT